MLDTIFGNPYSHLGIHSDSTFADEAIKATARGIGKATWYGAKKVGAAGLYASEKIGQAGLYTGEKIGKAGLRAAEVVGTMTFNTLQKDNLKMMGRAARNFGEKFVEEDPERVVWNRATQKLETRGGGAKLTKLAWAGIIGAGMVGSLIAANDKVDAAQMGAIDSKASSLTPQYAQNLQDGYYSRHQPKRFDNANATGDLVFALHKLR